MMTGLPIKKFRSIKFTLPIVGLIAATFLLMLIVGILTYLNYNREKNLMQQQLIQQGLTIIHALEAGTRAGMMGMMWEQDKTQLLLQETARVAHIDFIALVDEAGRIQMHSQPQQMGRILPNFRKPSSADTVYSRMIEINQGEKTFEITVKFKPVQTGKGMMMGRWMQQMWQRNNQLASSYVVLGLKTQEYDQARNEDVRRAVVSAVILFLLGSGALYFLLVAQNYQTVNRTLNNMQTYTQNVVESMPNGLISLDREGRIETMNRQAAELLNLDALEVKGKYLNQVLLRCNMEKTLTPPTNIFEQQMECHLNDGNTVPVSITSSRLKDENGEIIGTVVILRDLREIRSLEKKVERSEHLASLGRMASGIAHEIRNPLSSIKGFAQYFRNKFKPQSQDWNYADVMAKEVDRLNRVIHDLLNFARPQEPNLQPVEIQPLIQHALKLILSDLRGKNIRVKTNMNENELMFVLADSDMLTQALLNLFINAMEAMDEKGQLTIATVDRGDRIEINIQDTGSGIDREHLSKIFDPFYTTKKGGTGLGLAIVYRQIEQMQGEIEVKSKLSKGTTFKLTLRKTEY